MTVITWIGIALCVSQSALFSGLNLAVFSISRLRLEVEAANGSRDGARVLALRQDSNLTLTTILWGNVAVNVLLTLLSNSVLAGMGAFFFSTVAITLLGEILPQAYFSRKALRAAAILAPLLGFYRIALYPLAKPTAVVLDWWLGPEAILFFREKDFRVLISKHVEAKGADVGHIEGMGALNFLDLDDLAVTEEGEPVDPRSIVTLPVVGDRPTLPPFTPSATDPFLQQINSSGKKWVIITDASGHPCFVLDAHRFLRGALLGSESFAPGVHWHRPIVVTDAETRLGDVIGLMRVTPATPEDDVIDNDVVLVWGKQKRIITGADLLGRLLRGIATRGN